MKMIRENHFEERLTTMTRALELFEEGLKAI